MNKFVLSIVFLAMNFSAYAQLKVNSSGRVFVASPENNSNIKLSVGDSIEISGKTGISVKIDSLDTWYNYGINSTVMPDTITHAIASIGVMGNVGNTQGINFGVVGNYMGNQDNGIGVFGCRYGVIGINGRYAGYFRGDVGVYGTLFATTYCSFSDVRLKENISRICSNTGRSPLNDILSMNVFQYNYKENMLSEEDVNINKALLGDRVDLSQIQDYEKQISQKVHFGLSAQELREIYPNLVEEGQDGYLTVNYVELVPVLIQAIQELKGEIDEMKSTGSNRKSPVATSVESDVSLSNKKNELYQNTPNPAKGQTTIAFNLMDDVKDASICIFDMKGTLLKEVLVSPKIDKIILNTSSLGKGMFIYSLVINGQECDTRKMIIR